MTHTLTNDANSKASLSPELTTLLATALSLGKSFIRTIYCQFPILLTGISNTRIHETTTEEYPDDDPANLTLCTSTVVTFTFKSSSSVQDARIATKIPVRVTSYTPPPLPTLASSTSSLSTNSSLESLDTVSRRIKELETSARGAVDLTNTVPVLAIARTPPAIIDNPSQTAISAATQSVPVVPSPAATVPDAAHTSPAIIDNPSQVTISATTQSVPVVPSPTVTVIIVPAVSTGSSASDDRWYCVTIGHRVGVMRGW